MGDFIDRLGRNKKSPGFGHTQRKFHQIDLPFGGMSPPIGFRNGIDRIRPGREQFQLTALRTQLIFPIQNKSADHAAFTVIFTAFLFTVDDTVAQFSIIAPEIIEFADKILFRQRNDFVFTVFRHTEQTVKLVAQHRIVAFDLCSDITVFTVPANFDIVQSRLLTVDLVKVFDLRPAGIVFTVFIQQFLQIFHSVIIEMSQIFPQLLHLIQDLPQFPLVFLNIKTADPADGQG